MCLTSKVKFSKGFYENYKHMRLTTRVYDTIYHIPYRTKVWREKSLANLANFTKSPNFICQTSYHSITIVSIVTFSPNFIHQIDILHIFAKLFSRQAFVLYGILGFIRRRKILQITFFAIVRKKTFTIRAISCIKIPAKIKSTRKHS